MGGSPSEPLAMFSYTNPPGASVAWPPRDERQGWHMPPTRGGRYDGGVNDAAASPRATRLGKDEVDEDNRDGTAILPLRSVTLPARADGGDTTVVINDVRQPRQGQGEHRVALTGRWPAVSGHALESRRFTRDNWNYRE